MAYPLCGLDGGPTPKTHTFLPALITGPLTDTWRPNTLPNGTFKHVAHIVAHIGAGMMAGKPPALANVMVSPLGVVTRQSTAVLAAKGTRVIYALQIIRHHVTDELSVAWIASHVSRRTLERAFQADLGRGVYQEIQRRLETACGLLRQTPQRIRNIADALNFSSHQYFCQAFRTAFGK